MLYTADEEPAHNTVTVPSRSESNGQLIDVSLGHSLIDMDSRKAYYRSHEDFLEVRENIDRVPDDGVQVPIQVLGSGQVLVTVQSNEPGKSVEKTLEVSESERKIFKLLQEGRRKCSRLERMNKVIPVKKQMNMKSPERAMYQHINGLHDRLAPFGLFVDMDQRIYYWNDIKIKKVNQKWTFAQSVLI